MAELKSQVLNEGFHLCRSGASSFTSSDIVLHKKPKMKQHPNRRPFRGVLTILEAPSDRPPAGARGHRVVLTRAAAEAALPSLIGIAVDFTAGFDGHDARRKVGIITSADIKEGNKTTIEVGGYIFARDFPEVVRELQTTKDLGMSYEVADAAVEDIRAPVWKLTAVTFTGAAILRRKKAAYQQTSISIVTPPSRRLDAEASRLRTRGQDALDTAGKMPALLQGEPMNSELTKQFLESSARL